VELFGKVSIDWLGKKWYFLGFSLIFSVAGILSMLFWHGIPKGVDFKGGTLIDVKFVQAPNVNRIRSSMDKIGEHDARIVSYGKAADHEVIIGLALNQTSESALDLGRTKIVSALQATYSTNPQLDKLDLDTVGRQRVTELLAAHDPLKLGQGDAATAHYAQTADKILSLRDRQNSGLIYSFSQLNGVVEPVVVSDLEQSAWLSGFTVRNVEIVGPQVGAQLQHQALMATLFSLAGMLIYLWFRFEFIYGAAAVVAVFHDTLITVGFFSLTNQEITLTVIAAILTLIGYSMNDTIVVFDRIRENLRLNRREVLADVVNRSINQTLSRTVLTSGLTFLTVLSLYVFGGEVLHGFSFALVIGILIGTYSSIAVAAPMLVAYTNWREKKGKAVVLPSTKRG
jgi:preprotein translocase subunit SecF